MIKIFEIELLNAVSKVTPVTGQFRIGSYGDRASWFVELAPEATPEQIDAATAVIAAFDYNALVAADVARRASFQADSGYIDLRARLQTASVAEIDTWLTNNVTTLAQARTVLAAIIKILANMT